MVGFGTFLIWVLCLAFSSSLGIAQDLNKYRDFEFEMSLDSVAKQVQMKPTDARTRHDRPVLIQTLEWNQAGYSETAAKNASVRSIRFDFYNGELSKIVVTYNPVETNGPEDIIEAISTRYGPASTPEDSVSVS